MRDSDLGDSLGMERSRVAFVRNHALHEFLWNPLQPLLYSPVNLRRALRDVFFIVKRLCVTCATLFLIVVH